VRPAAFPSREFARSLRKTTVFRHTAYAEAGRHAVHLCPDHHPAEERLPRNAAIKAYVADAEDASSREMAGDIRAFIKT
jgi:hypothetical protein